MSDFKGDVLIANELDGGEFSDIGNENNVIFADTQGFETATYLSLFGGNEEDNGTESTKNKTWWGNLLEKDNPERQIISRTQNILRGLPAVPANIIKLKLAIEEDLKWFIDEKIADVIISDIVIPSKNRANIEIQILKNKQLVHETKYEVNWDAMSGGV